MAKTDWKGGIPDQKGVRYHIETLADGTSTIESATQWVQAPDEINASKLNTIGEEINNSYAKFHTATIGTTWTGSNPFKQTINVSGITENDIAFIGLAVVGKTQSQIEEIKENWNLIAYSTSENGKVTFFTFEKLLLISH